MDLNHPQQSGVGNPAHEYGETHASNNHLVSGFHFRGKLPHLKREGASYFVTFRLSDSLPGDALAKLKQERASLVAQAFATKRPLSWHEEQQLFLWYSERVEKYLDAGGGECWLRRPEIAELVAGALNFFERKRYDLHAWVVMPNHVHAVLRPYQGTSLTEVLHSWKSFTSKKANKILDRASERFWQRESYDHWVRDDDERARLAAYVHANPVKAALCQCPEDWPWSSANRGSARFQNAHVEARVPRAGEGASSPFP